MKKERIDVLLVEQGFFDSREKAKRAVMAGIVYDQYDRVEKPGTKIPVDSKITVKGNVMPYVSRGGLKLEKALEMFDIDVTDRIVGDVGSSTGGFTDCCLQKGARLVYAIDVGTNQLVWKLRNDPRVIVKEQTNFRYATKELFEQGIPSFICTDVSFISLRLIFEPLKDILEPGSEVVALIKPQFESEREEIGKKGIIKDPAVHQKAIENVIRYANDNDLGLRGLDFSPITGGHGNIEFLSYFKKGESNIEMDIEALVAKAHDTFRG